jgi:hypothetical protein
MNRVLRWSVTAVLALDAAAALAFLSSEINQTQASPAPVAAAPVSPTPVPLAAGPGAAAGAPAPDAAEPAAGPPEAPRTPAFADTGTIPGAGPDEPEAPAPAARGAGVAQADAFRRLLRAYENMEPESAARALAELAQRDRRAVVELVLGSKPRTSGAILDALTRTHPGLAADLSYEIWRRAEALTGS